MENISLPPGSSAVDSVSSQNLAGAVAMGHSLQTKDPFLMPLGAGNDLFNMTLRDVKKEPTDVQTCSHSLIDPAMAVFDFKDEGGGPIDPELQDLFDELTRSVPPLTDLELDKMLKQEEDFGTGLGRPNSASAAHPCHHLDKPIKTEYPSDFGQVAGSSPQHRPASAGPSFSIANTALASSPVIMGHMAHGHVSQVSAMSSRGLPAWPEISHAEQLKQIAANQQPKQPHNSIMHHQQQSQAARLRDWPSAMDPNTSPFGQEIIATPSLLSQPGIGPQSSGQSKCVANCLLKPNRYNQSNPTDIKALSTKPMLNFTPKAASPITSHMSGPQSKPSVQNQQSTESQIMPFHIPVQSSSCLQPKPLSQHGPVNLKITQQRQAIAPHLSANGHLGELCLPQQQCSSALNTQQNHSGKGQRHPSQPQHQSSDTEKFNTQDQFNRHLTRPPPDYKQPLGPGVQHSNLYRGLTSSPVTSNGSDQNDIQALSCHVHNGQRVKVMPSSGDRRFHGRSDPHSSPLEDQTCASKLHQPHNSQVQMGIHQNKPQFQGSNTQAGTFQSGVSTTQHVRMSVGQVTMPGQRLDGITTTTSREPRMSWGAATDKSEQTNGPFPTRPIGPPNQVAPHSGQIPLNSVSRSSGPTASHMHIPPLPGISSLNQSSPEQQRCMATFVGTTQSPGVYQNSRAGRLTFDFLQDGDNTVPGINADSDFIDSLLKSSSGNDDWMKDINLEEILGGHP
ncbi:mastermind-like protein 2 isoform X2 [Brachyhypopomus gauderio]